MFKPRKYSIKYLLKTADINLMNTFLTILKKLKTFNKLIINVYSILNFYSETLVFTNFINDY